MITTTQSMVEKLIRLFVALLLLVGPFLRSKANAAESLQFREVYDLIRSHLPGMDTGQLDQAAAEGLIAHLGDKVSWVPSSGETSPSTNVALESASLLDGSFAYFRVRTTKAGLSNDLAAGFEQLLRSNRLTGVVLDLRFANGDDYASAAAAADWFIASEQPLIDWGGGMRKSTAKESALNLPVAVLVNRETVGAPEALAGILREAEVGLILGTNTGGRAQVSRLFPLKSGGYLRIATEPVRLGNGKPISGEGIIPDITVEVSPAEERAFFANAYRMVARNSSNLANPGDAASTNSVRSPRRRLNEAELVRLLREGRKEEELTATPRKEQEAPPSIINDPVLARAIDLLKGLALVQQFRGR